MHIQFITQPDIQFGRILLDNLGTVPYPRRVIFVSAFSNLQTILRLKVPILTVRDAGASIRFVLGIDLDGTSVEVLREISSWYISAIIVKHRRSGHTFHPKLYLFEWVNQAEIIIGSSNITDGGLYGNYESSVRIHFGLPEDQEFYNSSQNELRRFLDPHGNTAYPLTNVLIDRLVARGLLPTEAETRRTYRGSRRVTTREERVEPIFGVEDIPIPPPPPSEYLDRAIEEVRRRRRVEREEAVEEAPPINPRAEDVVIPMAFYMTLPTLQGENIPGEGRIPLDAIELAPEFWGWPAEYERSESPRAGRNRIYWNWRPIWRVWSVESTDRVNILEVRMYMYENSSDFRLYVRPLINAGADLGDVVRIRRISRTDAEYECVLARRGTPEYEEWIKFCTQPVRNSPRSFGYA